MSNTSIRLSPELQRIKDTSPLPFSKRVNVMAERYHYLVMRNAETALSVKSCEVLLALPSTIHRMRASMIELLPRLIVESKLPAFTRAEVKLAADEVGAMTLLQRISAIENLCQRN